MNNNELHRIYSTTLENRKYSERTLKAYTTWIFDLEKHFSSHLLSKLSEKDINEYISHLKDNRKLSVSTIRQARNALNLLYSKILLKEFSLNNYPKTWFEGPQVHVPSQEEILSIIDKIAERNTKLAISLLYGTGIDLSELLNIKIKHIDLENKKIHITLNRKKGVRKVLIPEILFDELSTHCVDKNSENSLFVKYNNSKCSPNTIQKAFKNAARSLGIEKNYPVKSLRYAYIKHLDLLGIPVINTIQEMKLSKAAGIKFYSRIGISAKKVSFSPLDKIIKNLKEKNTNSTFYVAEARLKQLSSISNNQFDLTRLTEMLHELNLATQNNSYMSITMIVRAVIDHVAPIFNFRTFKEFTNNYGSSKSFKKSMLHLDNSLRNAADTYLHLSIRKKEVLPTFSQVDFRSDLDMLLSEIVRILK